MSSLYLYSNRLTGTLPPELARLSTLNYLSVRDNLLSGTLPRELGALSSLVALYAGMNPRMGPGPLPAELGALARLEVRHYEHEYYYYY